MKAWELEEGKIYKMVDGCYYYRIDKNNKLMRSSHCDRGYVESDFKYNFLLNSDFCEYIEPITNENTAVDTKLLVRNGDECKWENRYFAKEEYGVVYTWEDGRTSWSAFYDNDIIPWKYAKLYKEGE